MNRENSHMIQRMTRAGLKPPRVVTLAVTNQCNLRCRHCWPDSGPAVSKSAVPKNQVVRLIESFSAIGAEELVITGGEPLLHPEWFGILTFACSQPGVRRVRLQTNATQITPQLADLLLQLKDQGLIIQTSLEGALPESHDLIRGQGSYHQTLNGLNRLRKNGMARQICITFTEMQHNFEEIPKLLEMVDDMGFGQLITGTLVRAGRTVESTELAPPTPHQYGELLSRYHKDSAFRVRYRRIGNIAALEWNLANNDLADQCCTFIETPYVSAQGHFYPCVMLHAEDFAAKNAYTRSLNSIIAGEIDSWSQLERIKQTRVTDIEHCRGCLYAGCCGAGCMGRAYSASGEFMAVEDRCHLRKAIYQLRSNDSARLIGK